MGLKPEGRFSTLERVYVWLRELGQPGAVLWKRGPQQQRQEPGGVPALERRYAEFHQREWRERRRPPCSPIALRVTPQMRPYKCPSKTYHQQPRNEALNTWSGAAASGGGRDVPAPAPT